MFVKSIVSLDSTNSNIPIVNLEVVIMGENQEEVDNKVKNTFTSLIKDYGDSKDVAFSDEDIELSYSEGAWYENLNGKGGMEYLILEPEKLKIIKNDAQTMD
jgi:hypothetical protein